MSKPIVWVELPRRLPPGHEQHGRRPCVVIFDPTTLHAPRYPMLLVAPITSHFSGGLPLYVSLAAGSGGLPHPSTVLLDQIAFVDVDRVSGYLGTLTLAQYQPIQAGLELMMK